jgi:hypothetical protein
MVKAKNYNNVIKYLQLAYKNCEQSQETQNLKVLIKNIIVSFEKLVKKNEKKTQANKNESRKLQFINPEQTLKLIDSWIEEEKNNAFNDNQ